jgi:hypothetical protein
LITFANTQRIRRSSIIFWRCQSALLFSESQLQYPTGSEEHRRVDAARRRSSARAGHAPRPFWHRWPRLKPPRACPTSTPARFSFHSPSPLVRSSAAVAAATPASLFLLAVAKSLTTSSSQCRLVLFYLLHPWLHRLSFGKGALSVPATAAMRVSSPELRPPWLG